MNILKKITNLNSTIAIKVVSIVGTMWTAYAFTALVCIPLFAANLSPIILFISSSVLQLVLLPIIMVGQNLMAQKSEDRAEQDHLMIMSEFAEIKEMHDELKTVLKIGDVSVSIETT